MKMVRVLLAAGCGLVGLCVSTSATAKANYGYCETYAPHQAARVTPMFEFPAVGGDGIGPDFETYMEAKLGFNLMPMCNSYGDDEAHAMKMQAYALAQIKQDMPAILDEGFEKYVTQKYGGGRKSRPAPNAVADRAGQDDTSKSETPAGPSAAELASERHKAVEERNRLAQEKYEAQLAEQKRLLEEVARKKEAQRVAAEQALADHDAQLAAHSATLRQHDRKLAMYEREVAAQKLRKNFDERHKLGQASTDTDANQCITAPETQINASFQGNTAASVMNGCGQPVDVRICLMSDTGWKCGATYGLASQQRWSFSAFKATGEVFADARTSGSSRPLAKPN